MFFKLVLRFIALVKLAYLKWHSHEVSQLLIHLFLSLAEVSFQANLLPVNSYVLEYFLIPCQVSSKKKFYTKPF